MLGPERNFEINHPSVRSDRLHVGKIERRIWDGLEMIVHVKKYETVNRAIGRHDIGLQRERFELVFDIAGLAVFAGRGDRRESVGPWKGSALRMSNLPCRFGKRKSGQVETLAVRLVYVQAKRGEIDVDWNIRVIFEGDIDREKASFIRIGLFEFRFGAVRVQIRIGGDGETLVRIFSNPRRNSARRRLRQLKRSQRDESQAGEQEHSSLHFVSIDAIGIGNVVGSSFGCHYNTNLAAGCLCGGAGPTSCTFCTAL